MQQAFTDTALGSKSHFPGNLLEMQSLRPCPRSAHEKLITLGKLYNVC